MDKNSLRTLMKNEFKKMHPLPNPIKYLGLRDIDEGDEHPYKLFVTQSRNDYYQKLKTREKELNRKPKTERCVLCSDNRDGIIFQEQAIIVPNNHLFYDTHMLIRPLKSEVNLDNILNVKENVRYGKIARGMFDCRDYVTVEDTQADIQLAEESNYMVMQSMRGSGASVPNHIHSHAFDLDIISFPFLNKHYFNLVGSSNNLSIYVMQSPGFSILFEGDSSLFAPRMHKLAYTVDLPYNKIVTKNEIFKGFFLVYTPRTLEVPPPSKIFEDWKYGVFETMGLFEAKTFEQMEKLDKPTLTESIKAVTLQDRNFQNRIIDYIKREII